MVHTLGATQRGQDSIDALLQSILTVQPHPLQVLLLTLMPREEELRTIAPNLPSEVIRLDRGAWERVFGISTSSYPDGVIDDLEPTPFRY